MVPPVARMTILGLAGGASGPGVAQAIRLTSSRVVVMAFMGSSFASSRVDLVEQGIEQPEMDPEDVSAVSRLIFLGAVEAFHPEAQPRPDLPDQVDARVLGPVIGRRALG